jgi:hypothetical protein
MWFMLTIEPLSFPVNGHFVAASISFNGQFVAMLPQTQFRLRKEGHNM